MMHCGYQVQCSINELIEDSATTSTTPPENLLEFPDLEVPHEDEKIEKEAGPKSISSIGIV
jgi:hypothetical protein